MLVKGGPGVIRLHLVTRHRFVHWSHNFKLCVVWLHFYEVFYQSNLCHLWNVYWNDMLKCDKNIYTNQNQRWYNCEKRSHFVTFAKSCSSWLIADGAGVFGGHCWNSYSLKMFLPSWLKKEKCTPLCCHIIPLNQRWFLIISPQISKDRSPTECLNL